MTNIRKHKIYANLVDGANGSHVESCPQTPMKNMRTKLLSDIHGIYSIYLLTGYEGIASLLSLRH